MAVDKEGMDPLTDEWMEAARKAAATDGHHSVVVLEAPKCAIHVARPHS